MEAVLKKADEALIAKAAERVQKMQMYFDVICYTLEHGESGELVALYTGHAFPSLRDYYNSGLWQKDRELHCQGLIKGTSMDDVLDEKIFTTTMKKVWRDCLK